MLKSLFAGVSGLQSHQVAMDIESNNIANVNTVGFKYSRANFSDLLAQTKAIATAPQGQLGGKNPVQVGLGSTVSSTTRIFSQGSIQNSDKNTDVAIQGDGFFIISPDSGNTYKYTRAGDFKFDAAGNFVDNNGFVAQGWLRDPVTGKVDSTAPISNINIAPGLTTPANPTKEVVLKANLNSGPLVESFSPAYEVKTGSTGSKPALDKNGHPIESGDVGVMFNEIGEAFSLQKGQGIWASFIDSNVTATNTVKDDSGGTGPSELDITFTLDDGTTKQIVSTGGGANDSAAVNANRYVSAINAQKSITGISAAYDAAANKIVLTNSNSNASASHNIRIASVGNTNSGLTATDDDTTAYRYQYNPTGASTTKNTDKQFQTIADLREALENQARAIGDGDGDGTPDESNITVEVNSQGKFEIKNPGGSQDGDYNISLNITALTTDSGGASVVENSRFTRNMEALNSVLAAGTAGKAFSQAFNAATHSSSIDIFDSLGSKHTLRMEFRKVALDKSTGSTWSMNVSVPDPATIDTLFPFNEKTGSIRFNNDGSLATYNPPNISFSGNKKILAYADMALKDAKKRNIHLSIFAEDKELEKTHKEDMECRKKLIDALKRDDIISYFQPIVPIQDSSKPTKYESLVRLKDENNKIIPPFNFIKVAKANRIYYKITRSVIMNTLEVVSKYKIPCSINLSLSDIDNDITMKNFFDILDNYEYNELLTIELLETEDFEDYKKVYDFCMRVRSYGIKLALDDFGSGYANFSHILNLPVDYIKIDASLISDIDRNQNSRIMVETIVELAKKLHVITIAEFVSSSEILDVVKELGVDYAQGFYIGKPEDISKHLQK